MNIQIKFKTEQYNKEDFDIIEFIGLGKLYYKKDDIYIIYNEEVDGTKIRNTIKVGKNFVKVIKKGDINANLYFKENVKKSSIYKTKQERFFIDIDTKSVSIQKYGEFNVKVNIEYNIEIQTAYCAKNKVCIEVCEIIA